MKRTVNRSEGDDYYNRLLSYFRTQFQESIIKMIPMGPSVFRIELEKGSFIVKGYSHYKKLRLQEIFTATLWQEGFRKTYLFLQSKNKEPLYFEGKYFGCMEYIQPHPAKFTFHTDKSRMEGLALLDEFYYVTASCVDRYKTLLPRADLNEKWQDRLRLFKTNSSIIRYFIKEKYIYELLEWGEWSLKGMNGGASFLSAEPKVILHGDVAHHNFLRDSSGTLHLIDFDLISIGPASLDILQYANRILPYIDWSFDRLAGYPQIKKYMKEKAFLFALAYPTDIYREWNRVLRGNKQADSLHQRQVIDLTLEKFSLRRKFVDEVKRRLEDSK